MVLKRRWAIPMIELIHRNRVAKPNRLVCFVAGLLLVVGIQCDLFGQQQTPSADSSSDEQRPADSKAQTAYERFFEVLLRRPAQGVAFDHVYQFHVQNDSLDDLLNSLDVDISDAEFGRRAMLRGMVLMRQSQIEFAISSFRDAELQLPQNPLTSFYLAQALRAAGETDESITALRRALERNPQRRDMIEINLLLGRQLLRAGDSDQAVTVWHNLVERFPDDKAIADKAASALVELGQYEQASAVYQKLAAAASNPDQQIRYQIRIAGLDEKLDRFERSRARFESLLTRLRPGSWLHGDVRDRLERSYLHRSDLPGLIKYYRTSLQRAPQESELSIRLAQLLVRADQNAEAETLLRQAVERAPTMFSARLTLAELLSSTGKINEAIQQYEGLLAIDAGNPDYLLRMGQLHLNDSQRDISQRQSLAAASWNRLAELNTDDAVVLSQVAGLMRTIGQHNRAIELYQMAIDVAPNAAQYREYLGELFHRLQRVPEAHQVWRSIASEDRRSAESLVRVAEVFSRFGYQRQAVDTWLESAELSLSFEQRLRVANALSSAGQHDEAIAQITKAGVLVEDNDQRDRLMRSEIEILRIAKRLPNRIAELNSEEPTAANQRFLALLYHADGQTVAAELTMQVAIRLNPNSIPVLTDAAVMADQQGRLEDAEELLTQLIDRDQRFRFNHLRRLVDLRRRQADFEGAIEAGQQMIEANPASTESYRILANVAYEAGKHDVGERTLRRAMVIAPHDMDLRVELADRLADRFATREAISLYWLAIEAEHSLGGRAQLIDKLVPLYSRRGEIDVLVDRIDHSDHAEASHKTKQILIADVWAAVEDYQQARLILEQLLASLPRDPQVLGELVALCDQTSDILAAVQYQRQLVSTDDIPANRSRLTDLELKANLISEREAAIRQLKSTQDPQRIANIVLQFAAKEPGAARQLCEIALQNQPELWDVKTVYAQVLLQSKSQDRAEDLAEADKIAAQILALDLDPQLPAPAFSGAPLFALSTRPTLQSTQQGLRWGFRSRPARPIVSPSFLISFRGRPSVGSSFTDLSELERFVAMATFSLMLQKAGVSVEEKTNSKPGRFQSPISFSSVHLKPSDYGKACWIARLVQVFSDLERPSLTGDSRQIADIIDSRFPPPDQESTDANAVRAALIMQMVKAVLTQKPADFPEELVFRLAQLEPASKHPMLQFLLNTRSKLREVEAKEATSYKLPALTDRQLETLQEVCQHRETLGQSQPKTDDDVIFDMTMRQFALAEHRLAGKTFEQRSTKPQPTTEPQFDAIVRELGLAVREGNKTSVQTLSQRLVHAARSMDSARANIQSPLGWLISPSTDAEFEYVANHRQELIDTWLAYCSRRMVLNGGLGSKSRLLGGDKIQLVVGARSPGSAKRKFIIVKIHTPLSPSIISAELPNGLFSLLSVRSQSSNLVPAATLSADLIDQLSDPLQGATFHEQRLRRLVAAYAHWWSEQPDSCYERLIELEDQFPGDTDFQIELARLEAELERPELAFKRLDSVAAKSEHSKVPVLLASIILAAQNDDRDKVSQLAQQLLSMNLDRDTRQSLLDRLQNVASPSQSLSSVKTMLRQSQGTPSVGRVPRVTVSERQTRLDFADTLIESGDAIAASEIAFAVIFGLQSSNQFESSNERRHAIEILVRTQRLAPLIKATERRYRSSGNSERYLLELAELYAANQQADEVFRLWDEFASTKKLSPDRIVIQARTLFSQRNYQHAMMLYLLAFRGDPSLWTSHWNAFSHTVSMSDRPDICFQILTRMKIDSFPPETICSVLRAKGSARMSDAHVQFVRHVIETHPEIEPHVDLLLESIPENQRDEIPELDRLLARVACSAQLFDSESPLWQMRVGAVDGRVLGVLEDVLMLLWNDESAAKTFLHAAESVSTENRQSRQIADVLIAAFQFGNPSTRQASVAELKKRFPARFQYPTDNQVHPKLPPGLLWQLGQVISAYDSSQPMDDLCIGIYEAATAETSATNLGTENPRAPVDQLFEAYFAYGRPELARRGLLHRWKVKQPPGTTGVRENQRIRLSLYVARQLANFGYPIDSAGVSREVMNQPLMFQLARRYAHDRAYRSELKKQFDQALPSINSKSSETLIRELTDLIQSSAPMAEIDLYALSFSYVSELTEDSLFHDAVKHAVATKSGRESVEQLAEVLRERIHIEPSDPSIWAAALIATAYTSPDEVPSLLEKLVDRTERAIRLAENESNSDRPKLTRWLLNYHALVAINRLAISGVDSAYEQLVNLLANIAGANNNKPARMALLRLSHQTESLQKRLELIGEKDAAQPRSMADCDQCLAIAEIAADSGQWNLVAQAIVVALGNGPPERRAKQKVESIDEYGGELSVPSANDEDPIAFARQRLMRILSKCRDQQGRPLTSPDFATSAVSMNQDELKSLDTALRKILFPSELLVNVYPYRATLLLPDGEAAEETDWEPRSVAIAAGNIARAAGTSSSLVDKALQRVNAASSPEIAAFAVSIAVSAHASDAIEEAVGAYARSVHSLLPEDPNKDAARKSSVSKRRTNPPRDRDPIVTIADQIIHAVLPVLRNNNSQKTRQTAIDLLERTIILMNSNEDVQQQYAGSIQSLTSICDEIQ